MMLQNLVLNVRQRLWERRSRNEHYSVQYRRMFMKPKVELVGKDANVYNIIGLTKLALRRAGLSAQADEFMTRAFNAGSYDKVLELVQEYCEVE